MLIAAIATVIIPLVALLMWDTPSDLGLRPYGEIAATNSPTLLSSPTNQRPLQVLRRGMASTDFWRLFASFCICGMSTAGLIATHLIPGCIDHGIPEIKAAGLLATIAAFDLIGTISSGWASDHWDNRRLLFWCYGLRGLSLLLLPYAFDWSYGLLVFAAFYGFDWIATVPPTMRLLGDLFGREDGPLLFGWLVVGHQLGAGLAAYGAGWIRADRGEYSVAFVLTGLLCLLAAILSLQLGKPRQYQPASLRELASIPETTPSSTMLAS
jgi:MFS family permease